MSPDELLLVTGMHRSGTSLLAKRLKDAGVRFLGDLLPANDDNPEGFWESRKVVDFNNQVFAEMGLDWRSHAAIDPAQMGQAVARHSDAAAQVLRDLGFDRQDGGAIKDPRLCRLAPIWIEAAKSLGLKARLVAVVRPPSGVAASLFRRIRDDRWRPAGLANPSKTLLLWMRYNLDLERAARDLSCRVLRFEDLRGRSAEEVLKDVQRSSDETALADALDAVDVASLATAPLVEIADRLHALMRSATRPGARHVFDAVEEILNDRLRAADEAMTDQPGAALDGLVVARIAKPPSRPNESRADTPMIGFVSGEPRSRGHIYRVENRIESLIGSTWACAQFDPEVDAPEDVAAVCDLLVVFRMPLDDWLDRLFAAAAAKGVPTVFDIDDLLFVPDVAEDNHIALFDLLSEDDKRRWMARIHGYRSALKRATRVWTATEPLARYAARDNDTVDILPNGLSDDRMRIAASTATPLRNRETVTLGYASGTPTHDRDFGEIADVIAELMAAHRNVTLTIVGALDWRRFARLLDVSDRISHRPLVPYRVLPHELAGFDINLAPLERDNPFCECKSELKYFEAAAVSVPTVASATTPFRSAITSEVNGLLCETREDWLDALTHLATDAEMRRRIGRAAFAAAKEAFGPRAQSERFRQAVQRAVEDAAG